MKSFGEIFLSVALTAFIISAYASGNTHYVTQTGGGGAMSAADFNSLTWDYSGETFYFSGNFTTRIVSKVHGSPSGFVTLDGLKGGTCNPTANVDKSLCVGAANLQYGMHVGSNDSPARYIFIQNFNMDATPSTESYVVRIQQIYQNGQATRVVFRRNTIINAPSAFFYWWGNNGPYNVIEDNKFFGMGQKGQFVASTVFHKITNSVFRRNIVGHDFVDTGFIFASDSRWGHLNHHQNNRFLVEQNRIFGGYRDLVRPKEGGAQSDLIIRHNTIYNGGNHGIFPYAGPQDRIYIYGNHVSHVYSVGIWISGDVNNSHVWANIVKDVCQTGIGVYTFGDNPAPQNSHVSNNTVVYNGFENETMRAGIRVTGAAGTLRLINNIVAYNDQSRTNPKQLWYHNYSSLQSTHNLTYSGAGKDILWSLLSNNSGNATHTISQAQSAGYEQNSRVEDPGFVSLGVKPTQTQSHKPQVEYTRDLRLTASSPAINSGQDLSSYPSFSVNLSGGDEWFESYTGYGTITFSYDDGLHPNTDWTTPIPTVVPAKFSQHGSGWERGAYVFAHKVNHLNSPSNVRILNHF